MLYIDAGKMKPGVKIQQKLSPYRLRLDFLLLQTSESGEFTG